MLNSPDKVMNVKIFDDLDSSEIIQSRKHTILPLDASPAKKIIASTQKIDTKILRNAMKESEKKNKSRPASNKRKIMKTAALQGLNSASMGALPIINGLIAQHPNLVRHESHIVVQTQQDVIGAQTERKLSQITPIKQRVKTAQQLTSAPFARNVKVKQ